MISPITRIFAAAVLLAGCAGGVSRIGGVQYESHYDSTLVLYAARSGEIPVVVSGSPSGDPESVVSAMRMPAWMADARFVPSGAARAANYYHVVLVFGHPAKAWSPETACAIAGNAPATPTGRLNAVQAAFCAGTRPVSSLIADGPSIRDADDPAFRQFLGQVITVLLPAKNPRPSSGGP